MSKDLQPLLDRTHEAGKFTLDDLRDYYGPQLSHRRIVELTMRVHLSITDLTEAERVCALVAALMMELI
jgi:hypothetical protein